MAMVDVDSGSLYRRTHAQPKSFGLVLGRRPLGAVLHSSNEPVELSQWLWLDDSTINIVLELLLLIIIITRNTFCRTRSLSNATFSFLITWRKSSSKSAAVYKISWKSDDFSLRCWYNNFQNGGRPPSWNCYTTIRDHPRSLCCWPQLPVKFHVNLIHRSEDIAIWIFRVFGLKCLFSPRNGSFGDFGPINVIIHHWDPKRHILA